MLYKRYITYILHLIVHMLYKIYITYTLHLTYALQNIYNLYLTSYICYTKYQSLAGTRQHCRDKVTMFSDQTMFCPVAYCPVAYCPIAYCPVAYCLLHKNTETVTFFLVVLNALFAVTNLKQICCAQLYKICII